MLVVRVEINGKEVDKFTCVRRQSLMGADAVHKYELYGRDGGLLGPIFHKYSDGALVLARLMLEKGNARRDADR